MEANTLIWISAVLLTILGLAGAVMPSLPGPVLLFGGLFMAAWAENFTYVGMKTLIALAFIVALTYLVEFAASAFGAKRFGASRRAMFLATLGGIAGVFFGVIGILVGPFAGAVIGELSLQRGLNEAGRAGLGATIGMALGMAAKVALSIGMVVLFLAARFM